MKQAAESAEAEPKAKKSAYWTGYHSYELRFRQRTDVPQDYKMLWSRVYEDIVVRKSVSGYLDEWVSNLEDGGIGTAVDRQKLKRFEGGVGGDSNNKHRQIRFWTDTERRVPWSKHNEIVLRAESAVDYGEPAWTVEELHEFGDAFKRVLVNHAHEGIDFYIAVDTNKYW